MTSYCVTYQVMNGNIGLITVKNTYIRVEPAGHDDAWVQVVNQIRSAEPTAKIVDYWINDECDDMIGSEIFY